MSKELREIIKKLMRATCYKYKNEPLVLYLKPSESYLKPSESYLSPSEFYVKPFRILCNAFQNFM